MGDLLEADFWPGIVSGLPATWAQSPLRPYVESILPSLPDLSTLLSPFSGWEQRGRPS
jgi:hypothetical protein